MCVYFIMSPESEIKTCEIVLDRFQKKNRKYTSCLKSAFSSPWVWVIFFLVLSQIDTLCRGYMYTI